MIDFEKRGIDIQLFAEEGNSTATPETTSENNVYTGTNPDEVSSTGTKTEENTSVKEEAIHDDKDPLEVLKATAEQLGLDPNDIAIMTQKELQAEIDRRITEAIKTREAKLKKQQEYKEKQKLGQYEELLREERVEALKDLKTTYLTAKGVPQEISELINVSKLADKPLTEGKEELVKMVDTVAKVFNDLVEQRVAERIKNMEAGTFNAGREQKPAPEDVDELLRQKFFGPK